MLGSSCRTWSDEFPQQFAHASLPSTRLAEVVGDGWGLWLSKSEHDCPPQHPHVSAPLHHAGWGVGGGDKDGFDDALFPVQMGLVIIGPRKRFAQIGKPFWGHCSQRLDALDVGFITLLCHFSAARCKRRNCSCSQDHSRSSLGFVGRSGAVRLLFCLVIRKFLQDPFPRS